MMKKEEILKEIEVWKKIDKQKDSLAPEMVYINESIKNIELKMLKYFLEKYNNPKLVDALKRKGIIDSNNIIIHAKNLKITDVILNFGSDGGDGYYINPKSALMLYNAYLEFDAGKINNNIRKDLDYHNITYKEIRSLNSYECIYWCYVHNISFKEFASMNFIHECAHRFGINAGDFDDPYLYMILSEGVTELIARDFAKNVDMPYVPIFRNQELEFIYHFYRKYINNLMEQAIKYKNSYKYVTKALSSFFGLNDELDGNIRENFFEKVAGIFFDVKNQWIKEGLNINVEDSFITIIDKMNTRWKNDNIIEKVEMALEESNSKKRNV